MTKRAVSIGEVLDLHRRPVVVDPSVMYRNVGLLNRGRGLFEKPKLSGSATSYSQLYELGTDQLVYSKLFAWEGAITVVPVEFHGAYVSSEFPTFDLVPDKVLPAYLRHVVSWEGFEHQLRDLTTGLGQRRQRVNVDDFVAAKVPLPPIDEQRRIATHLDSVASVGQSHRHSRAYFRGLKARLLESVTGDELPLADLLSAKTGEPVEPDRTDYRITGVYSFGKGLLSRGRITGTETKYRTLTQLAEGDVVYSKLGAFEGAVAVVDESFAGSQVTPEFPVFSTSGAVDSRYLHHVLTSPIFETTLTGSSTGVGARQKRVHPSVFLGLTVPLPPLAEQRRIGKTLDKVDDAWRLSQRASVLYSVLLPAARNEVFNSLP